MVDISPKRPASNTQTCIEKHTGNGDGEYNRHIASSETKNCKNCKKEFTIEPEDFAFYGKMGVPPPTWCPECRNIRRLAWREDRALYKGKCALCGKAIITVYAPGGPFTIYCRECWHSDKWDPMDYGREYDFSKSFFEQYRKLAESVPRPALTGTRLVNSDYSHGSIGLKNCYFVFWSYFSEDSQYSDALLLSRNTYDSYTTDNSDQAYETLHSNRLYRSKFVYFSDECLDSSFLYNCVGCSDCFGCVNLRKQKYRIFNEQFSKVEYEEKLKYWDLGSYERQKEAKEKFYKLCLSVPHRPSHVINGNNVTGDIIRDSKNCQNCFSTLDGVENCKYIYFGGLNLKDSYDVSASGDLCELLYETFGVLRSSSAFLSSGSQNSKNITYTEWTQDCSDVFGCIALKKKKHCILNRQYDKEQYKELVEKIKKQMEEIPYTDTEGRSYGWGEFFPTELSAYAYNETHAFVWYPKTKAEVVAEGWRWQEPPQRTYEITKKPEDLPDHIRDAPDSILEETIGCAHQGKCNERCLTAFRLTVPELSFYRQMNLALPRFCPNCRHAERIKWRNGYDLHEQQCMCPSGRYENTAAHFHANKPCSNKFKTTYASKSPEIIYCDPCFKAEFL